MKQPNLSIVIPALKEEKLISSTLKNLFNYLRENDMTDSTEVIVVAADGNDKTAEISLQYASTYDNMKVIQPGSPVGKGRDVLVGMKAATGKKIIFMDADLATPLHHIKELTEKLDIADLVIGSRKFSATHSGFRRVASSILNKFTRLLIGLHGIRDTQCGFKGFTASSADLIFNRQTILGWGFDIEILLIAKIHKLKILQIPIPDWKDPKGDLGLAGESTLSASFRTLREVLKIKINKVRGCYK